MFEKFVEDIRNMPVVPPILLDMDLSNDPNYNLDEFKKKILHNAEIPDDELYNFIKSQYKQILKVIYEMSDPAYIKFFTSHKFINNLSSVLGQVKITDDIRMYCNKIIYDYITFDGMHQDTASLMINLSYVVNRDMIMQLRGIGLSDENANYIALAGKSSDKDTINVRRVNFIIATTVSDMWANLDDEENMFQAEQLIIKIYERMFKTLTILFEACMFDVYDPNASYITDKIDCMYSLTSIAILRILNNFPVQDIRQVLYAYSLDSNVLSQSGRRPRFSLHNLSADFGRISYVVEQLAVEGIYVP